jgi:ribosomal protein S18 acetylase RimI-like enzyme
VRRGIEWRRQTTVGESQDGLIIRRLAPGDAVALAEFYNGLSERSRRTFRPLGWTTNVETCAEIVRDNLARGPLAGEDQGGPVPEDEPGDGGKYDLLALSGTQVVGWSFVWNLNSDEPVFGLGIADAYQGQGLGAALMDRVLGTAQSLGVRVLYLTVVQDNYVAWQMYERRGFRRTGEFVGEDGLAYFKMARAAREMG